MPDSERPFEALLRRIGSDAIADLEEAVEHGKVDALARVMVRGINEVLERDQKKDEKTESPEEKRDSMIKFADFLQIIFKRDIPTNGGNGLRSFVSRVKKEGFESFPPDLAAFLGRQDREKTLYNLEVAGITDIIPLQTSDVMEMWEDIRRQVAKRGGQTASTASKQPPMPFDADKARLTEENQQLKADLKALQIELAKTKQREVSYRERVVGLGEKVQELGQRVKTMEAEKKSHQNPRAPEAPLRSAPEQPSASLTPNDYLRNWLMEHPSGDLADKDYFPLIKILRDLYSTRKRIEALADNLEIQRHLIPDSINIDIVWSRFLERLTANQIRSLVKLVLQN